MKGRYKYIVPGSCEQALRGYKHSSTKLPSPVSKSCYPGRGLRCKSGRNHKVGGTNSLRWHKTFKNSYFKEKDSEENFRCEDPFSPPSFPHFSALLFSIIHNLAGPEPYFGSTSSCTWTDFVRIRELARPRRCLEQVRDTTLAMPGLRRSAVVWLSACAFMSVLRVVHMSNGGAASVQAPSARDGISSRFLTAFLSPTWCPSIHDANALRGHSCFPAAGQRLYAGTDRARRQGQRGQTFSIMCQDTPLADELSAKKAEKAVGQQRDDYDQQAGQRRRWDPFHSAINFKLVRPLFCAHLAPPLCVTVQSPSLPLSCLPLLFSSNRRVYGPIPHPFTRAVLIRRTLSRILALLHNRNRAHFLPSHRHGYRRKQWALSTSRTSRRLEKPTSGCARTEQRHARRQRRQLQTRRRMHQQRKRCYPTTREKALPGIDSARWPE